MGDIQVAVYLNDGLTKCVYGFDMRGTTLVYTSYFRYEIDTLQDTFVDEMAPIMDVHTYAAIHDPKWDDMYDDDPPKGYEEYYEAEMKARSATQDGRSKSSGQMGGHRKDHPLPAHVAASARKRLIHHLQVEGLDF